MNFKELCDIYLDIFRDALKLKLLRTTLCFHQGLLLLAVFLWSETLYQESDPFFNSECEKSALGNRTM